MTTVVGAVEAGKVFLAADSQATDDNYYAAYDVQKLIRKGDVLMGLAGDYRATVALEQAPPGRFKYNSEPSRYMTLYFANNVHDYFEQYELEVDDFEALIGTKGMLFHYNHMERAVSPVGKYYAVGTGATFALGSMYETAKTRRMPIKMRLMSAVEAGIHFDAQTGGEVGVLSL